MRYVAEASSRVATSFCVVGPEPGPLLIAKWEQFLSSHLGDREYARDVARDLVNGEWRADDSHLHGDMLSRLIMLLETVFELGLVTKTVHCDDRKVLQASRLSPLLTPNLSVNDGTQYVWASDCTLFCSPIEVRAEAQHGNLSVLLFDDALVAFVVLFRQPNTLDEAREALPSTLSHVGAIIGELLVRQGLLLPATSREHLEPTSLSWYERIFQDRVRTKPRQGHNGSFIVSDDALERHLVCPPPAALLLPFDQVVQLRRSCSDYREVISLEELTDLCWFASQSWFPIPSSSGSAARPPYPSAGGFRSLAIKCVVFNVRGAVSGIYCLSKSKKVLSVVVGSPVRTLEEVAEELRHSLGKQADWQPQAVIIVESDPQQVSAKYQGIALSLLLKEAGALLQMVHLVGAAMNLSVCAIGVISDRLLDAAEPGRNAKFVRLLDIAVGGRPQP